MAETFVSFALSGIRARIRTLPERKKLGGTKDGEEQTSHFVQVCPSKQTQTLFAAS
jgi:hypothetical protein